jgi:hypothetical protein
VNIPNSPQRYRWRLDGHSSLFSLDGCST